ncbi:hypothetical protein TRAPUB_4132 [Trametes pubescens]|uniref:Uncharacterized protein n=1 Tax=Trametes pubescens TaxID=154538 RepID=A0A1M2VC08_TRAPU|nr:hypothetical protein TRAPUB_4132 [Trametes pubescens]
MPAPCQLSYGPSGLRMFARVLRFDTPADLNTYIATTPAPESSPELSPGVDAQF